MRQLTPTVKHLLIINIIVFLGTYLLGNKDFFLWFIGTVLPIECKFHALAGFYAHVYARRFSAFIV